TREDELLGGLVVLLLLGGAFLLGLLALLLLLGGAVGCGRILGLGNGPGRRQGDGESDEENASEVHGDLLVWGEERNRDRNRFRSVECSNPSLSTPCATSSRPPNTEKHSAAGASERQRMWRNGGPPRRHVAVRLRSAHAAAR